MADNVEAGRSYGHGLRYSTEYHGTGEVEEQGLLNFLAPHWYELKPKTRIINGFEVPAPETKELSHGEGYYIPSLANGGKFIASAWSCDSADTRALKRGLVFLRKEDAIATTNAMLGIDPKTEEQQ